LRKKIAQNENFVSCATFAKNIFGFSQIAQKIAQKSLRFMRKNSAKAWKKSCAKIAQFLRKRFSHFVETLISDGHKRQNRINQKKLCEHIFMILENLIGISFSISFYKSKSY